MFQDPKRTDARKSERFPTHADGSCTSQHGFEWWIQYQNLSPEGCCVKDPRQGLELGALVKLEIAGTGPHHAEVVWREGDNVGLEFVTPLPIAVFHYLVDGEWEQNRADERDHASPMPVRQVI